MEFWDVYWVLLPLVLTPTAVLIVITVVHIVSLRGIKYELRRLVDMFEREAQAAANRRAHMEFTPRLKPESKEIEVKVS